MKSGPPDFLSKPVLHENLREVLERVLATEAAPVAVGPRKGPSAKMPYLSRNPRMKEVQSLIAQIAFSDVPILIQGETGSGKEVIARELHAQSRRADQPFLKLNCAALPSELVESELFGYERG